MVAEGERSLDGREFGIAAPVQIAAARVQTVDLQRHLCRGPHQELIPVDRGIGGDAQAMIVAREYPFQVENHVFGKTGRVSHVQTRHDPVAALVRHLHPGRIEAEALLGGGPVRGGMRVVHPAVGQQDRVGVLAEIAQIQDNGVVFGVAVDGRVPEAIVPLVVDGAQGGQAIAAALVDGAARQVQIL